MSLLFTQKNFFRRELLDSLRKLFHSQGKEDRHKGIFKATSNFYFSHWTRNYEGKTPNVSLVFNSAPDYIRAIRRGPKGTH